MGTLISAYLTWICSLLYFRFLYKVLTSGNERYAHVFMFFTHALDCLPDPRGEFALK